MYLFLPVAMIPKRIGKKTLAIRKVINCNWHNTTVYGGGFFNQTFKMKSPSKRNGMDKNSIKQKLYYAESIINCCILV